MRRGGAATMGGMRTAGGRRIAIGTIAVGAFISLGALFAAREMILEQWTIHRLRTGDYYKMSGAIHRLREMRSQRAAPLLLEVAAASKTTPDREKLSSHAWVALSEIRPGECFLLARLRDGPPEEKAVILWLLAEAATANSRAGMSISDRSSTGNKRVLSSVTRGGMP